ncbi:50S ribosomal protein L23 [bacterium]|jgi:large subunit ribosomal protein L23|nr:50S ribosomal protein L23 [bacterium]
MAINIFKKEKVAKKETVKKENKEVLTTTKIILKSPCITEKAVNMSELGNFYVFLVNTDANKVEIKNAIESKYKVDVIQVRTINIPRKKVMKGRKIGFKNAYKKAIVKIKEGQKIEIVGQ